MSDRSCYNCGKPGHFSRECPDERRGGGGGGESRGGGGGGSCYSCGKPGHMSRDCTERGSGSRGGGGDGGGDRNCYRCGKPGHISGGCGIPILDPEEVGRQLNLDPKVIDWLKKEPVNDEIPILVLSYQQAFFNFGNFDADKQTVSNALINLGAILVSDNVFKFNDWPTLFAARDHMLINMRWCFYHPDHALAQQVAISNQPTIQTTAITWCSETKGKLTTMPYEFFKL